LFFLVKRGFIVLPGEIIEQCLKEAGGKVLITNFSHDEENYDRCCNKQVVILLLVGDCVTS